jgi:hypothetical protein
MRLSVQAICETRSRDGAWCAEPFMEKLFHALLQHVRHRHTNKAPLKPRSLFHECKMPMPADCKWLGEHKKARACTIGLHNGFAMAHGRSKKSCRKKVEVHIMGNLLLPTARCKETKNSFAINLLQHFFVV